MTGEQTVPSYAEASARWDELNNAAPYNALPFGSPEWDAALIEHSLRTLTDEEERLVTIVAPSVIDPPRDQVHVGMVLRWSDGVERVVDDAQYALLQAGWNRAAARRAHGQEAPGQRAASNEGQAAGRG